MAPLLADIDPEAVTRVMQSIVSGIGFLGAGAIIKMDHGERVEGLTTAAGIWMTSAIGMAAGMGTEVMAIATTLIALAVVGAIPGSCAVTMIQPREALKPTRPRLPRIRNES